MSKKYFSFYVACGCLALCLVHAQAAALRHSNIRLRDHHFCWNPSSGDPQPPDTYGTTDCGVNTVDDAPECNDVKNDHGHVNDGEYTKCAVCQAGTYDHDSNATTPCVDAPIGQYVPEAHAYRTHKAPANHFINQTGTITPGYPCDPGHMAVLKDEVEGSHTKERWIFVDAGATHCVPCGDGEDPDISSTSSWGTSGVGHVGYYDDDDDSTTACKPCQDGFICPIGTSRTSFTCHNGYKKNTTATPHCTPCENDEIGTPACPFQDETHQCPGGSWINKTAFEDPITLTYTKMDGSTGQFSYTTKPGSLADCTACGDGFYSLSLIHI